MVNPTINSGTKYAKSHAFTGYDKPKVGVKTAYLAGNVTPQLTAKGDAIAKMAFKAISEGFKELSEPKGGLNFAAKDALNQFIMKAGMNAIMNGSYGMKDDGLKELAGTPSIPAELKEAIETVLKKSEDNKPALPELTDKMMAGLKELAGNPSIPAELKEAIETVLKKSEDNKPVIPKLTDKVMADLKEFAGNPSIPAELKEAIETVLKKSEDNKPALPELTDKMMAGLKELAGNPSIPAELKEATETVLKKSEDNKPVIPKLTDKVMADLKELAGNPSIPAELKEAIETVLKKSEDNPIADINADPALLQKFLMDTGMGDVFGKPDNFENEQNGPVTSDDILGKILMILEKLMDANNDKQDTTNGSPIQTTPTASGQGGNQGIIIPPNFTGTITIGA